MAQAVAVVAMVATVASAAYQASQSAKAAKEQAKLAREARELGKKNAMLIQEETQETARRQKILNERQEGSARALAAATGAKMNQGSLADYLGFLEKENQAELDWLVRSGASRASLAREQGNYSYQQGMAQADITKGQVWGSLLSGLGSAANMYSGYKTAGVL